MSGGITPHNQRWYWKVHPRGKQNCRTRPAIVLEVGRQTEYSVGWFDCRSANHGTGSALRDAETAKKLLANLEHEFRVPRHSVWLGPADGQYERHLRVSGGASGPDPDSMVGGSAYWITRTTHHRALQRQHVDMARAPEALFPHRRHPQLMRADSDAKVVDALDGRGVAVDLGFLHQHQHGAIPRVRGRSAAGRATHPGLRHAESLHRAGSGGGIGS